MLFHEQAVYGRSTKWKKDYLMSVGNIAMWLYHFLAGPETVSLLFKEKRQIEVEKGYLDSHVALNRYANSPRKILIHCIPTNVCPQESKQCIYYNP